MKRNIPELLAPAGDLQKLKTAILFGADAVYFGLPGFSLRARVNKFSLADLREGADFCRKQGKRFYITINIYAHNRHLKALSEHLKLLNEIKPDAVILSDPGILRLVKRYCPQIPIHLSTQANAVNTEAVKFWAEQGVKRVILAREVTLAEIKEIKQAVPKVELEVFAHGAMCMAYSGRCILSKWMTGRSANLGDCAQPCRWAYREIKNKELETENNTKTIIDDKNRFMLDLEEDEKGTYFFNSYDLCLIEHLNELIEAGVNSFKIEGRGKSVYYVAVATRAYRKVLDAIKHSQQGVSLKATMEEQKKELENLSHRGFWTGFVLGDEPPHLTDQAYLPVSWEFVGISKAEEGKTSSKIRQVFIHNQLSKNDQVEVISPMGNQTNKVVKITNSKELILEKAHGGQNEFFNVEFKKLVEGNFLLRKKIF